MQVSLTGRNINITEALKHHAEERAHKIEKYFNKLTDAAVVLSVEKYRHKAEITIRANGTVFHGTDVTEDMYLSIDKAVEKLEQQVKRYKDKLKSAKNKGGGQILPTERVIPKDNKKDTWIDGELSAEPYIVKRGLNNKPMTVEDAIIKLNSISTSSFFVFINSNNELLNVVYKRKDGNIGLIEPE